MSIKNPETANALADQLDQKADADAAELDELESTRNTLEGTPMPDGGTATDTGTGDTDTAATDEGTLGYTMTEDRRVGSMPLTVDGHGSIRFGKPSGRASAAIMGPLDDADDDAPLTTISGHIWGTLAEWSLDEEYDADFWADETGLMDAIVALRSVAMGGNVEG